MDMIFASQKVVSEQVERNISAFNKMESTLTQINDENRLHRSKDDCRDQTIQDLVVGNNKFYKTFSYLLVVLVIALVVLAGAEKALKFIPAI